MITIVDYQMGNLRSVQKALVKVGADVCLASHPEQVLAAEKLVLPGVGAFPNAMRELSKLQLIDPLRQYLASGRPFLGICLGMQLLFESSSEGGGHAGLGYFPGTVERLDVPHGLKVPHIGWNQVHRVGSSSLLDGLAEGSYFYFVHSYYVIPRESRIEVLRTEYGDAFCSMVRDGSVVATQFHPEKSQETGLRLLENFVRWRGGATRAGAS